MVLGLLFTGALLLLPLNVFAQDAEVSKISRPRISGIIDMHEHYRAGAKISTYFDVSRKLGIKKTLFVPTGEGPDNAGYEEHMRELLKLQKRFPQRIIAFCTVDSADPEAPDIFKDCLNKGGKGLKLMSGHPNFYTHPLDSEIMRELFGLAREHGVPVLIHASIINFETMKDELMSLLNAFPDVRVQFAHYCSTIMKGINLNQCEEFLDRYPNLIIDISMGGGIKRYHKYMSQSAENMQKIKDFLLKYQNRIVYGSDMILSHIGHSTEKHWLRDRIMCDLNLHQKKEYKCAGADENTGGNTGENTGNAAALLPGFDFSDEILRKIYIENPKAFLKLN